MDVDWVQVLRWLGIGERAAQIPEKDATVRPEFASLPQNETALATVLAAAALMGLAFWVYRREGQAPLWKKLGLASIRACVIGLVFIVLLEPQLAVVVKSTTPANTIVLWDDSLSMSLPDRYLDDARRKAVADAAGIADQNSGNAPLVTVLTRSELAYRIVEKAGIWKKLDEKNKVRLYAFGEDSRTLAWEKLAPADVKPRAPATDLARAVRRALEEQNGRNVAAFVVITDGRINKGEGPKAVAGELRDRGIPFYAIGIGDPTPPKNLDLHELVMNERAYKNDPLVIEGRLRHRGYEGEKVDVELWIAPADNPQRAEKLGTQQVELKLGNQAERVTFTHVPKEVGKYVVTLKVPPRDEELVKEDNVRQAPLAVIDDETRILLVSGSPTYEYRFLKNLLIRDKTVQLSTYLQSADESFPQEGTKKISAIPRTKDELQQYDVICLLDPNVSGFDREMFENLQWFVGTHGGGLLFVAGEKYSTAFLRGEDARALLDLLPVIPDLDKADADRGPFVEQVPFKLTDEAEESAITRLDQDLQRSKAIWAKVPGAFWHYPVLREKPGAAVLVRHGDGQSAGREPPLIVTHFFGPGRTIFNATDETWRWRAVAPKAYDRFWVQAIRYLVEGRLLGGQRRAELVTDKSEYSLGEVVRVRAKAKDVRMKPLEVKELAVEARDAEGSSTPIVLKAIEGRPGNFEATFLPDVRGQLELTLRLPDLGADEKPASVMISVRFPDLEFANPRLDEGALQEIATATGGALVALVPPPAASPDKPAPDAVTLANLADRIPDRTETQDLPGAAIPLWDNPMTMSIAIALLGIEWFLRKRARMV